MKQVMSYNQVMKAQLEEAIQYNSVAVQLDIRGLKIASEMAREKSQFFLKLYEDMVAAQTAQNGKVD